MTTAERISKRLGDDGTTYEVPAREGEAVDPGAREDGHTSLRVLVRAAGAVVWTREATPTHGRAIAYRFADGSGIVDMGGAWDLALSPDCYCWAGAGHVEGCEERDRG